MTLPNGWSLSSLKSAIGDGVFADGDWVESKDQDPQGSVRLIQLADVGEGRFIDKSSRFLSADKADELGCTFLEPGDVLISRMADPIGRACIFPGVGQPCVTVVDVCIARPPESRLDARWLTHAINAPQFRAKIEIAASGTTRSRVSRGNLGALELPIPPLNEQRRIVAKLEALQSRSRRAREALDAVPPLLEKLRQSILAAAFRGDLTKDWRAQNPNPEPASFADADEHAGKGKKRLWGSGHTADGVDPAWGALPDSWRWLRIRDLNSDPSVAVQIGPMSMKSNEFVSHGTRVLNVGCVQRGRIDITKADHLPADRARDFDRYRLEADDVLFTRSGTVGRCAILPQEFGGSLMTFHLLRVRPSHERCDPALLLFAFQGCGAVSAQIAASSVGATRAGFNTRLLADMWIPVPPRAEQHELIARVSKLLARLDALGGAAGEIEEKLIATNRATLAKAFRGELVPQDPSDEPADTMLARLRTEPPADSSRQRPRGAKAAE